MAWIPGRSLKRDKTSWKHEVKILEGHAQYGAEFIKMLSEFECMWDGCLERVKAVPHWIELSLEDT